MMKESKKWLIALLKEKRKTGKKKEGGVFFRPDNHTKEQVDCIDPIPT